MIDRMLRYCSVYWLIRSLTREAKQSLVGHSFIILLLRSHLFARGKLQYILSVELHHTWSEIYSGWNASSHALQMHHTVHQILLIPDVGREDASEASTGAVRGSPLVENRGQLTERRQSPEPDTVQRTRAGAEKVREEIAGIADGERGRGKGLPVLQQNYLLAHHCSRREREGGKIYQAEL